MLQAELEGPVEAPLVGDEHGQVPALVAEGRHHLDRVGELRDPLGVHEAGRLDDRQPGGDQPPDELDLDLDGDDGLLVLEPVARADLVDRDPLGQRRRRRAQRGPLDGSTTNRVAPSDTCPPTVAPTAVTMPATAP